MTVGQEAVAAVARRAALSRTEATGRVAAVLGTTVTPAMTEAWARAFREVGRLTLNFHPDRNTGLGVMVAEGLCEHGAYFSQFKTGISNGSRSAVAGGERDGWEQRLFDGEYQRGSPDEHDRPVYGSFDLVGDPHGGSPRFGSSFVVLADHVRGRATLCVGDSHAGPRDVGTFEEPLSLLAGLFEQAANGRLLERPLGVAALLDLLAGEVDPASAARVLDGYVELQVHGGVSLAGDVEAVVLDPSFRDTDVERHLLRASARDGFTIDWHVGSELAASDVPSDFRSPQTPVLAQRVARPDGIVDAAAIGLAARSIEPGPPGPAGDAPESDLQQIKYLWHAVLALGHDAAL